MNPLVFRAALRASARIAFGVAAVGCGGVVGSGGEPPQAALEDAAGGATDATGLVDGTLAREAAPAEAGACDPPSPSSLLPEGRHVDASAAVTATTFDCCVAKLETIAPGEEGASFRDAAAADPEIAACCAAVIARLDYEYGQTLQDPDAGQTALQEDLQASAPVRWECCGVTPAEGPTCTPWGPPMPPAMSGVA